MLLIILVTTLVTIITLIITSIFYLVSFIADDQDDADSLAIDMHDFRTTPTTSPMAILSPTKCENSNHHHLCNSNDSSSSNSSSNNNNNINENNSADRLEFSLTTEVTPYTDQRDILDPTLANESDTSPMKSILEGSLESQNDQKQQQQRLKPDANVDLINTWSTSATAQKSIITNQLGAPISKQLFDDFEAKEIQLGGTGLHWCKTRKSLD